MATKQPFPIGTKITFAAIYNGKAGKRCVTMYDANRRRHSKGTAVPLCLDGYSPVIHDSEHITRNTNMTGVAIVTGYSWRIMSEYELDSCDEYCVAEGKREFVMLVRLKPTSKEYIVRLEDAAEIGAQE